jgi:hypothetical protein
MTPNLGAGGNAAIETAAALANELKKMVDSAEKGKPSFDTIKTHLGNYQKIREQRITAICEAANGLTRVHALKTWKDKMFAFWILPSAGDLVRKLYAEAKPTVRWEALQRGALGSSAPMSLLAKSDSLAFSLKLKPQLPEISANDYSLPT